MNPVIVRYEIRSPKVKDELKLLFLADLHGVSYGEDNSHLIGMCRKISPDLILLGGDMVTCRHRRTYRTAAHLIKALTLTAPVYAVNGNHETCAGRGGATAARLFENYVSFLKKCGVIWVNNKTERLSAGGSDVAVTGYEAPLTAYRKFAIPCVDSGSLPAVSSKRDFSILLAHTPALARTLFSTGADLILSGHYHGGVMRFGRHGVLVSPYGFPFPRFGYGHYSEGESHLIVTSGLGDHAIPFRVNNPCEIVLITVRPDNG